MKVGSHDKNNNKRKNIETLMKSIDGGHTGQF